MGPGGGCENTAWNIVGEKPLLNITPVVFPGDFFQVGALSTSKKLESFERRKSSKKPTQGQSWSVEIRLADHFCAAVRFTAGNTD
jgi:hypothetical protein